MGVSGDPAFEVTADAMMRAAAGIRVIAATVRDGLVEGAPDEVDFGHAGLATTASDFCARWNRGVSHLIRGNEAIGERVEAAVRAYVAAEESAAAAFDAMWEQLDEAGV